MITLPLFLKPIVYIWVGLNFLDDLSSMMKITRLAGASLSIFRRYETPDSMCGLCDDVVEGLMRGSSGLQAVPCTWLCLRVPKCLSMCESIQKISETATQFPCVAAGYCEDDEESDDYTLGLAEMECKRGPLFSCEPSKYCRRKLERKKMSLLIILD